MDLPRAWCEIELSAIGDNLAAIRHRIPQSTGIIAVIKANAYGHGAATVAHYLSALGVEMFAVGDSEEGLELRAAEITAPILILGSIVDNEIEAVIRHRITPSIHSTLRARQLNLAARRLKLKIPVHLKVDTGSGRLGVRPERALALAREIQASSNLYLEGVFTHLATNRVDGAAGVAHQVRTFERVLGRLKAAGIDPPLVHAANSAYLFGGPAIPGNRVRPGIGLYGMGPQGVAVHDLGLRPALSLHTQVVFLKDLPAGHPVGYNQAYITGAPTRVAVLPIGYNDGYPYGARGADVLVLGRRAPVIGTVTMDYLCVDVTHVPGVRTGTRVTLVGRDQDMEITLAELAGASGTIPYAIPCLLGSRVKRIVRWPSATPRPLAAGILA
ncbi:MAG: alanine racemase [Planctomycetes bacterium]|nr:alanine racemase [Planctomycetota bacterium]